MNSSQFFDRKRLILIAGGLLVLTAGIFATSRLLFPVTEESPNPDVSASQSDGNLPSPSVVQIAEPKKLSSMLDEFRNYQLIEKTVYDSGEAEMPVKEYKNTRLGISFLYPAKFYFKAGEIPGRGGSAETQLLAGMTGTPERKYNQEDKLVQKEHINSQIECRTDPAPGGICAEGIAPWLEMTVVKNPDPAEFLSRGDVEVIGDYRTITTTIPGLDGTPGYVYLWLIPKDGEEFAISVSTKTEISKDRDYKFALWLLFNSFRAIN